MSDKRIPDNGIVTNEAEAKEVLQLIGESAEFETLALMPTTRRSDGKPAYLVVAVVPGENKDGKRGEHIYPLAALFDSDPFDTYNPPEGGVVMSTDEVADSDDDSIGTARLESILGVIEAEMAKHGVKVNRLNADKEKDGDDSIPGGSGESKEDYSH